METKKVLIWRFFSKILASVLHVLLFINSRLIPIRILDRLISRNFPSASFTIKLLALIKPSIYEYLCKKKALFIFKKTYRRVPAYAKFLLFSGIDPKEEINSFEDFEKFVPQTTKINYVRKYKLADRCINGQLPKCGFLDESAGTTGIATDWVRSAEEEKHYLSQMKPIMKYLYEINNSQQYVLLNGFIQGAWAGSRRFLSAIGPFGIIKNTGPDAHKIIHCIKNLGLGYKFLIGGYPPLLKETLELGRVTQGFDWKNYEVHLFTGGEGFVEEWRVYIGSQLKEGAKIFSMYGALDLELGIAVETPLSVAIRKLLNKNEELRSLLLSSGRRPCYLGQFSPVNYFIRETLNDDGVKELEVTLLNLDSVSPKIKYNICDEGGVIKFDKMCWVLMQKGYDIFNIVREAKSPSVIRLPFLYLYGRSDGSVTIDGALIYPSEVSEAVLSDKDLASKINTFKLSVEMDDSFIARLFIYLEAKERVEITESFADKCLKIITSSIVESNPCFKQSFKKNPEMAKPVIQIIPYRTGIFSEEGKSLKYQYIKK